MTGVREKKKQAVRDALYRAALDLFRDRGYHAVTAAEIAEAAGVAKGTLFNHFPAKADIIAAWYADEVGKRLEAASSLPVPASLSEALIALTRRVLDLSRNEPALWQAQIAEAPSSAAIQAAERRAEADIRRTAATLIAAQGSESQAAELADLYVTLITGTVREWVVTGREFPLDTRLAERIERLCRMTGHS